jgi:hypothetical protein
VVVTDEREPAVVVHRLHAPAHPPWRGTPGEVKGEPEFSADEGIGVSIVPTRAVVTRSRAQVRRLLPLIARCVPVPLVEEPVEAPYEEIMVLRIG